ncbi:toxin glutamine deamidase domain-containing protein [Micromonospora sp. NBC_01655]|uniref:toxin glutamine deamidase domain-containing protein n=1 Tax=Micromonospora sp. NBC_01655 TaxID=2975983 RepID=UPI0022594980|nr:toxin glutamine deamidase domain-containing protein [Micromonospora sp. NBC_01655]MCX4474229.1 toxin glutamine deamidase domain-containing protein [Micromonospora sp. NBC_01655]
MSLLPSPIPHPLDYSPWELPGWVYEALDWVIGVEWPEGDERAVWDLADQWYGVAEALAGPHRDAIAAAGEVRSGYGGLGAVAEAFDAAWRRVADGDEAPLPVLLAVSGDLGRLVEECGCDIEGAKLEVWIELGILVIELLSLAVATVLTAGAASPAAGAAITASRFVVQQIFKRLMAQLARKTLKRGLKEAGERAAKQVAEGGVRGLARKAALGGLAEAAEESGVTLATQAYQNTTGRRHGLDLADAGMSALGGLAGGAVAPLAGLGRHTTGRAARVGEHFGREMTGEVIAEQAASLATGQGPVSLEEAARAAASGATGSATGQTDAALRHRLDGRMAALAGASFAPVDLGDPLPLVQAVDGGLLSHSGSDGPPVPAVVPSGDLRVQLAGDVAGNGAGTSSAGATAVEARVAGAAQDPASARHGADAGQPLFPPSSVASTDVQAASAPAVLAEGNAGGVAPSQPAGSATDGPPAVRAAADPTLSSVTPVDVASSETRGATPGLPTTSGGTAADGAGPHAGPPPSTSPAVHTPPVAGGSGGTPARPVDVAHPLAGSVTAGPGRASGPQPRSPEWYAAKREADRGAADRRRYSERFQQHRALHEDNRRNEEARQLRDRAAFLERRASEYASYAVRLERQGKGYLATSWQNLATVDVRASYGARDLGEAVLAGTVVPEYVEVTNPLDFYSINTDDPSLVLPTVEAGGPSALTGDDDPPPIDRSRRYGQWGGLRPPLALHHSDLEQAVPRDAGGQVLRTADPRQGSWFRLANDGGPAADPTRGINCLDCTLSLYETWMHGRPRVSAPRTFDGYAAGDVNRPLGGEIDGPGRVEDATGGRFQQLAEPADDASPDDAWSTVNRGFGTLEGQLRAGGHGSYAFLITSYEGGGSHAWVALNQHGSVLYLDPQSGAVSDLPLYTHSGLPAPFNVRGIDALVLGPDGRAMPLAGAGPGRFSQRPDEQPSPVDRARERQPGSDDPSDDDLYVNRMHLLEGPGSGDPGSPEPVGPGLQGDQPAAGPEEEHSAAERVVRQSRVAARVQMESDRITPTDIVAASSDLDQILAAGVTPAELADQLDGPTLCRLVPHLDEVAAQDVARLFGDHRVRQMLEDTWKSPPGGPLFAETLVKQLAAKPSLARMIQATPELADSLTARPMTLHHLASHDSAIAVLESVADAIDEDASISKAPQITPEPQPTPLTPRQREISASVNLEYGDIAQPGFDQGRRADAAYRSSYLDGLYEAAAVAQKELVALATGLAYDGGREVGHAGWRAEPKRRQRAEDKIKKYEGDASQLLDLAGAKVEFDSLDHVYAALERLRDHPAVRIVRYDDRFQVPQKSGYRDVQLILRMSNGHLAELRLHLAALDKVAVWEHSLYEVKRDLESLARRDGRELTIRERAMVDGILARQRQLFWNALKSAL